MERSNLKIGTYELTTEETETVNKIIGSFLDSPSTVIEGVPPDEGSSRNNGNQYRLNVNDERYVSVKLSQHALDSINRELFTAETRELLNIPHYKVQKENNFPLPTWKKKDYIIIDWGPKDKRFHIGRSEVQQSLKDNNERFLEQMGIATTQNYLFGISDRKKEHFIWDLDDYFLFSIDHELLTDNPHEVTNYFNNELKNLFGEKWFDEEKLSTIFSNSFNTIFETAENNRDAIVNAYLRHNLSQHNAGFINRLIVGSQAVLQRLMN